jgi:hypothetical protein
MPMVSFDGADYLGAHSANSFSIGPLQKLNHYDVILRDKRRRIIQKCRVQLPIAGHTTQRSLDQKTGATGYVAQWHPSFRNKLASSVTRHIEIYTAIRSNVSTVDDGKPDSADGQ